MAESTKLLEYLTSQKPTGLGLSDETIADAVEYLFNVNLGDLAYDDLHRVDWSEFPKEDDKESFRRRLMKRHIEHFRFAGQTDQTRLFKQEELTGPHYVAVVQNEEEASIYVARVDRYTDEIYDSRSIRIDPEGQITKREEKIPDDIAEMLRKDYENSNLWHYLTGQDGFGLSGQEVTDILYKLIPEPYLNHQTHKENEAELIARQYDLFMADSNTLVFGLFGNPDKLYRFIAITRNGQKTYMYFMHRSSQEYKEIIGTSGIELTEDGSRKIDEIPEKIHEMVRNSPGL